MVLAAKYIRIELPNLLLLQQFFLGHLTIIEIEHDGVGGDPATCCSVPIAIFISTDSKLSGEFDNLFFVPVKLPRFPTVGDFGIIILFRPRGIVVITCANYHLFNWLSIHGESFQFPDGLFVGHGIDMGFVPIVFFLQFLESLVIIKYEQAALAIILKVDDFQAAQTQKCAEIEILRFYFHSCVSWLGG